MFGEGGMYVDSVVKETQLAPAPSTFVADNASTAAQTEQKDLFSVPVPPQPQPAIVRESVKYIDKPQRKITEIRVFYDDGTYETFKP